MNRLFYALVFVICPFLSSCFLHKASGKKGKHAAVDTGSVIQITAKPDTAKPAPLATDAAAANNLLITSLAPLWAKRLDYRTFSTKAKIRYETPEDSKEFTANIRMRKDSVIWVNVTLLGLSAARIFVTKDSIFVLNFVQREVMRIPLSEAARILPTSIEFSSLQNLIAGDPLRGGAITAASATPEAWQLEIADSSYLQNITYAISDSTMRKGSMRTHNPNGPQATIDYNNYELTDNRKVSKVRAVKIQNGNDHYSVDMDFSNTEFDRQLEYPFSIPKNYKEKK
jgi:hypothetical protein